jgi:tetratricopeptide (TPR) repeat protein
MAADLADPPLLFETLVGESPDALGPHELALLAFCLGRPLLRDVALVQWAAGLSAGDAAYQAQIRYTEGEPLPDDVGRTMIGEGPRPDTSRLEAALELCRRAAAAAPRESRPGALAACAWISWALGRSTHAAHYVEQALGIDPHHRLSAVVAALVEHSRLPEWAFARPAEAAPTVTSQAEKGSSLGSRGR